MIDFDFCCTTPTPLVYDDSLSLVQQVAKLFGLIQNLNSDTVTNSVFQEFQKELNAKLQELEASEKNYTDAEVKKAKEELKDLINAIQIGMLIYDVTRGDFEQSPTAMRDLFNDVTVHAITVETLANLENMTVDDLSECGLNVRGLAVYSGQLKEGFTPEGIFIKESEV